MHLFKWVVFFTLSLFLSTLVFVTGVAFLKKSGRVALDMAKIHHSREPARLPLAEKE